MDKITVITCSNWRTSHFHLFVELDVRIIEQQGYLAHILADWVVELALLAIKVLMERTRVTNGHRRVGRERSSARVAHTRGSCQLLKALSTTQMSCVSLCLHPLQFRTV